MKRGGEVEVDVPVTKNSSHLLSSGRMIAAGNEGESKAGRGAGGVAGEVRREADAHVGRAAAQ